MEEREFELQRPAKRREVEPQRHEDTKVHKEEGWIFRVKKKRKSRLAQRAQRFRKKEPIISFQTQ